LAQNRLPCALATGHQRAYELAPPGHFRRRLDEQINRLAEQLTTETFASIE
jgi:hypothetical protein